MANKIEFEILGDAKALERSLRSVSGDFKTFGKNLSKFVSLPIGIASTAFVKLASDAEETANKFNVVFREIRKDAGAWAESFGNSVGRSTDEIQKFSSGLGDVLKPLGFTTQEAFQLSQSMTQLALDVASFNNRQDADVIRAFTSALTGERESLKTLGIVINEVDVRQEALNLGLVRSGQQLSKTAKAQATYSLLLKNTEDAQGDLLRTQDSFANQLKTLQASTRELGVNFGKIILPAATKLVSVMNSLVGSFSSMSIATQQNIVTIAGLVAVVGPLTFLMGNMITLGIAIAKTFTILSAFRLFGLVTSVGILAKNVGLVYTSLLAVAGIGAAAFAGWNVGRLIGEMTGLDNQMQKLLLKLDLFGQKSNKARLKEEERLNAEAVARNAEFLEKRKLLQSELADRQKHEEDIKDLSQETFNFLRENNEELKELAAADNAQEIEQIKAKWQEQRDALISHLNLQMQILQDNGSLETAEREKIESQIFEIKQKFLKLEEQAEKKKTKQDKKTLAQRLANLQEFSGETISILRQAGVQTKALEITNAVIQQGGAIMKAWNSKPFPYNLPAVALTTAQTGLILSQISSAEFARGTANIPRDMPATVHQGEMIVPASFSDSIRKGDLSLSGGGSGEAQNVTNLYFDGAQFMGVTSEIVKDIFTRASQDIANKTLVFRGAT